MARRAFATGVGRLLSPLRRPNGVSGWREKPPQCLRTRVACSRLLHFPVTAHAQKRRRHYSANSLHSRQPDAFSSSESVCRPTLDLLESATTIEAVLDLSRDHAPLFSSDPAPLPAFLSKILDLAAREDPRGNFKRNPKFSEFSQFIIEALPSLPPETTIRTYFVCCKYELDHSELVSALAEAAEKAVEEVSLKQCSLVLSSLGERSRYDDSAKRVFAAMARKLVRELRDGAFIVSPMLCGLTYFLSTTGNWSNQLSGALLPYLHRSLHRWRSHRGVATILWVLRKQAVNLRKTRLLEIGGVAASKVAALDDNAQSFVMMSWVLGSLRVYQEDYFNALADRILAVEDTRSPFLTARLLSTVAWACGTVGFYHPSLMDHIAMHSLARLADFNSHDLGNLAYAFGYLNHPRDDLLLAIVERMEQREEFLENTQACCNIAWACMVHNLYSPVLLSRVFESGSVRGLIASASEALFTLLQLNIAVTHERQELNLPKCGDISDVSVTVLDRKYSENLNQSTFESNMLRSLMRAVGGSGHRVQKQAITRCLYTIDAELLLDTEGEPICRQRNWLNRRYSTVKRLIAKNLDTNGEEMAAEWEETSEGKKDSVGIDISDLVASFKEAEDSHTRGSPAPKVADSLHATQFSDERYLHLASDWQDLTSRPSRPIARRIALEADGPTHYAINCRHPLGRTVLKRRQLAALGWEVISIPYFEWQWLDTDDDHVRYLRKRIFGESNSDL